MRSYLLAASAALLLVVDVSLADERGLEIQPVAQIAVPFDGPVPLPAALPAAGPAPTRPGEPATAEGKEEPTVEVPRAAVVPLGPKHIRLHLFDASVISGDLSVSEITVDTSFGKLVVPIEKIRSFTPGLDSNPKQVEQLQGLIDKLGSDDYKTREQAHKDLAALGMKVRKELESFLNSENAEVKRHVTEIIKELEAAAEEQGGDEEQPTAEQPWIRLDTVVTTDFTVIGKISPPEFTIQSKYGPLNVKLADVKMAARDTVSKESLRKTVTVDGSNIAQRSFKNSGIRVEAGDKITLRAEGNVIMSPWGSNAATGPDGAPNYGWYVPNSIPGGALVARIGEKGQVFKVGRQTTFVAKSAGVLQLAIGIQAEYANEGYQYPGQYSVKLRIDPR
jgi:type 1 fimbria pilin